MALAVLCAGEAYCTRALGCHWSAFRAASLAGQSAIPAKSALYSVLMRLRSPIPLPDSMPYHLFQWQVKDKGNRSSLTSLFRCDWQLRLPVLETFLGELVAIGINGPPLCAIIHCIDRQAAL